MAGPSRDPGQHMGCIGTCTSGLSQKDLDMLTDHIQRTLISCKGRLIFREYLTQANRRLDVSCLDLYANIRNIIDDNRTYCLIIKSATTERLTNEVRGVLTYAEDLDIPEIDVDLLAKVSEAIESKKQFDLIRVLDQIKDKLTDHLRQAYEGFRIYVKLPCPKGAPS